MITYKPRGVCAQHIQFNLEDGIISDVQFVGGCNGNLKAIAKLVDGKPADEIASLLEGNTCGRRPTSCGDQLARAIRSAQSA